MKQGRLREKDNYLMVADCAALRQYSGNIPGMVTVKESTDFFYQWMEENVGVRKIIYG